MGNETPDPGGRAIGDGGGGVALADEQLAGCGEHRAAGRGGLHECSLTNTQAFVPAEAPGQEADAVLGADPGAGQAVTSHGTSSCMYGTCPAILSLNLVSTGGKADYDHVRAHATAVQLVDISGVGDAAFGTFHGPAASERVR